MGRLLFCPGPKVALFFLSAEHPGRRRQGSPYDFFGARAHPAKEVELWKKGQLTGEQWANRLALREAMLRAGFRPLAGA